MEKDMMRDMEKGIEEGMDAPVHQIPETTEDEERLIRELPQVHQPSVYEQVEGGAVAGKMNPVQKKWLAYWLLVAATSVIVLKNNNIHAAPKDQLFPPEFAMFVVFLSAIWLISRAMKQMM